MKIIIINETETTVYKSEYLDVPLDITKAIKSLLDGYNNGVFINVKETEELK